MTSIINAEDETDKQKWLTKVCGHHKPPGIIVKTTRKASKTLLHIKDPNWLWKSTLEESAWAFQHLGLCHTCFLTTCVHVMAASHSLCPHGDERPQKWALHVCEIQHAHEWWCQCRACVRILYSLGSARMSADHTAAIFLWCHTRGWEELTEAYRESDKWSIFHLKLMGP